MTATRAFGLGLSALAVLIAVIFVYSGTASATVLCEAEMEICPEGNGYPAETKLSGHLAEGTTAVFKTAFFSVECKVSTLEGKTLKKEAEPLTGEITSLKFSGCNAGETACTVTAVNLPFSASFSYSKEAEKQGDGTMAIGNNGKGKPAFESVCGGFIKCTYASEPSFAIDEEPSKATASGKSAVLEKGGFCPKEATISLSYEFSQPESGNLFVAKEMAQGTVLCKKEPPATGIGGNLECEAMESYSGAIESTLVAGQEGRFAMPGGGEIFCNKVKLAGNFQVGGGPAGVNGGIQTFTFQSEVNNVLGDCTSNLGNPPARVGVLMVNTPYNTTNIVYTNKEKPQGAMGIQGTNGPAKLRLTFGALVCEFKRDGLAVTVTNGTGAGKSELALAGSWEPLPNQPGCPGQTVQLVKLKFERPGNAALYVAKE